MMSEFATKPVRVQLSRKAGWRLPPNTVSVARPSKWGNPFTVAEYGRSLAVANFRNRLIGMDLIGALDLSELRGKNLACWCRPHDECHADILLEMANRQQPASTDAHNGDALMRQITLT